MCKKEHRKKFIFCCWRPRKKSSYQLAPFVTNWKFQRTLRSEKRCLTSNHRCLSIRLPLQSRRLHKSPINVLFTCFDIQMLIRIYWTFNNTYDLFLYFCFSFAEAEEKFIWNFWINRKEFHGKFDIEKFVFLQSHGWKKMKKKTKGMHMWTYEAFELNCDGRQKCMTKFNKTSKDSNIY